MVIKDVLTRAGLKPEEVSEVIIGHVLTAGRADDITLINGRVVDGVILGWAGQTVGRGPDAPPRASTVNLHFLKHFSLNLSSISACAVKISSSTVDVFR